MKKQRSFFYKNGLCITFFVLMLCSLAGQIYTGWKEHNDFLMDYKVSPLSVIAYLRSGHFIQATFENWESEFFQMALFVILTIFLRQKGSSESKGCDESLYNPEDLLVKEDSPYSVKKGGIYLAIYKHSLSISLFFLFICSFFLHWYGSWVDFNERQSLDKKPLLEFISYLENKKFWFESFQNWQSEFLSIFAIIFLSIFLRQIGSSQSKAVNAPHYKTGDN
ncbi:MAG TPA: DUF6766 family protein [Bacteroidia bacterium]|jgi:hypothetical protein|nr:DUF6766 family protein [Bacteroidia bacterium]